MRLPFLKLKHTNLANGGYKGNYKIGEIVIDDVGDTLQAISGFLETTPQNVTIRDILILSRRYSVFYKSTNKGNENWGPVLIIKNITGDVGEIGDVVGNSYIIGKFVADNKFEPMEEGETQAVIEYMKKECEEALRTVKKNEDGEWELLDTPNENLRIVDYEDKQKAFVDQYYEIIYKYEKYFGFELDPYYNANEDTYIMFYHPIGLTHSDAMEKVFECDSLNDAITRMEGMEDAFKIAIQSRMGVPERMTAMFAGKKEEDDENEE